jgi:hypothetical protein
MSKNHVWLDAMHPLYDIWDSLLKQVGEQENTSTFLENHRSFQDLEKASIVDLTA